MSSIEDLEARLKAQEDALEEPKAAQRAVDLEAFLAARDEYGVSNVARMFVGYTPGLPTFALAKTPTPVVIKRYRDSVRSKDGKAVDASAAAEAVCTVTLIYPDPEIFAKMCEARPGLKSQLGVEALGLAAASETASGKG
jgi:hypothetical protein